MVAALIFIPGLISIHRWYLLISSCWYLLISSFTPAYLNRRISLGPSLSKDRFFLEGCRRNNTLHLAASLFFTLPLWTFFLVPWCPLLRGFTVCVAIYVNKTNNMFDFIFRLELSPIFCLKKNCIRIRWNKCCVHMFSRNSIARADLWELE